MAVSVKLHSGERYPKFYSKIAKHGETITVIPNMYNYYICQLVQTGADATRVTEETDGSSLQYIHETIGGAVAPSSYAFKIYKLNDDATTLKLYTGNGHHCGFHFACDRPLNNITFLQFTNSTVDILKSANSILINAPGYTTQSAASFLYQHSDTYNQLIYDNWYSITSNIFSISYVNARLMYSKKSMHVHIVGSSPAGTNAGVYEIKL